MRLLTFVGMGVVAAVCASTAALAFQEQQGSTAAPAQPQAGQAAPAAPAQDNKGLGLGEITTDPAKSSGGTEVRIPGLGKLGVLPKMDFGLELLYGAAEERKPVDETPVDPNNTDDLTIRGSVKHRF
jgi:hypothetical protein